MQTTSISWTDHTWNPVFGCSRVSPGCEQCYAEALALRFGHSKKPWTAQNAKENVILKPHKLKEARSPKLAGKRVFVNSTSDLFHELVPSEYIDLVFDAMESRPDVTFQVLTKRPERMMWYMRDPMTPHRIAKLRDARMVAQRATKIPRRVAEVAGFPSYLVSNEGEVYSTNGSAVCAYCGEPNEGSAHQRYCSQRCAQISWYHRERSPRPKPDGYETVPVAMSPDVGEDGHCRVMLYRDGVSTRELVHHLVLGAFDRLPMLGEQGCHRDGNPQNNHIANLRWGTQADNWEDSKRHGTHSRSCKLSPDDVEAIRRSSRPAVELAGVYGVSDTQIRNVRSGVHHSLASPIEWPPKSVWLGVSVEDQRRADERIPLLVETPATVRFLSVEPMLGPIDLRRCLLEERTISVPGGRIADWVRPAKPFGLHWVIVGGESGPHFRPMELEWALAIRDQCEAAGVAFFFKQEANRINGRGADALGRLYHEFPGEPRLEAVS